MTSVRHHLDLDESVGMCNALRRALQHDVKAWAPCTVTMLTNTTCRTDEYLAHRIGLVPFRRVGSGDTMRVSAVGPRVVVAGDLLGPSFEAVHPALPIVTLGEQHELECVVRFDEQTAAKHARYAPCAAVGMCQRDGAEGCRLSFEVINGASPRALVLEALDSLDARVDAALHALAHQPETPPQSFC